MLIRLPRISPPPLCYDTGIVNPYQPDGYENLYSPQSNGKTR